MELGWHFLRERGVWKGEHPSGGLRPNRGGGGEKGCHLFRGQELGNAVAVGMF